jgi:outer membrane lipoprotein SlyB
MTVMQPNQMIEDDGNLQAVVGVFESAEDASRVAASLRGPDVAIQRVSLDDSAVPSTLPSLRYEEVDHVDQSDVNSGMIKGGAIGAGSGLLLFAVPGLNIAAPIAGALAGAFIGGVAGVDETKRAIELPNEVDYRQMLADGKSFVVIGGSEQVRMEFANRMKDLGAIETHQHPPVLHAVRNGNA